jgi:exosome complex component RRP42
VHFLDATTQEEGAAPMRLILIYSFTTGSPIALHGMRLLGSGEMDLGQIELLVKVGVPMQFSVINSKL